MTPRTHHHRAPARPRAGARRLRALRHPRFRRFLIGRAASLLGSGMNTVATAFAVLRLPGGGVDAVGLVMAARIVAILAVLLLGGVLTDRLGARAVMLAADLLRFAAQGALAALLLTGGARLWQVAALAVVVGVGEGGFNPGLTALVPGLVAARELTDANSLLQIVQAVASVAGPGLAGLLVALWGPGPVVAADAVSYALSVLAVAGLPPARAAQPLAARQGLLGDLVRGWGEFASRTWLWVTTVHMGLFNLVLWAPFLVLGPALAQRRLGGAGAWGVVLAVYGAGSVIGGLALLGRDPRRALAWSMAASAAWALPAAALAARLPLPVVVAAALPAGVGATVCGTLLAGVAQREIPAAARGRVGAFNSLGAFALGPLGLALAGPVAGAVGADRLLAFGAAWQLCAVAVVLALPAVRRHGTRPPPAPATELTNRQ